MKVAARLGDFIVKLIVDRTRNKGQGLNSDASRTKKLSKLAESTIKKRRSTKLHPSTTPERSNLTMTGRLLDSLDFKVKPDPDGVIITIYISDAKANEYARYVSEEIEPNRPFLGLSSGEYTKVNKELDRILREEFRNNR